MGATLADLARIVEPGVTHNMETASRYGKLRRAAWAHLSRERGNVQAIREELARMNRERLTQCIRDQSAEFYGRNRE